MHPLRAIEQCEALLRFELQGLQLRARQRFGARDSFTTKKSFAFANHAQGQMRERREVAAGTYRALFRNHRMHTSIEHVAKQLDYFATNSAESERQHIRP